MFALDTNQCTPTSRRNYELDEGARAVTDAATRAVFQ